MTVAVDKKYAIEPHPDDAAFMEELRRLAFLSAEKFGINLKSVAHKAMPNSGGEALCYQSECLIRLVLRHGSQGKWALRPLDRKRVIRNLGWFLPTLLNKEAKAHAQPRVYLKKKREEIISFLMEKWVVENIGTIDLDEVNRPVI